MAKPFRGVVNVDITQSVPDWEPYTQPIAPEGTPDRGRGVRVTAWLREAPRELQEGLD